MKSRVPAAAFFGAMSSDDAKLLRAAASDSGKLLRAAGAGDDAKVKRLLKAKADVNIGLTNLANGTSGITALHEACTYGHVGAVRLLLKARRRWVRPTRMVSPRCIAPALTAI